MTLCLLIESVVIHPSLGDVSGLVQPIKNCYLYITCSSCGCALLPRTVPGPAKLIWHLQIAWRWNHITVFRFQFHPSGKYCFKPLLFIKRTSYPLCAAIVLHGPCLQLCPWDNGIRDVQAAELAVTSATKDQSAMIEMLKWCLHRNVVIIPGVRRIKHRSLDETIMCWNGVAYKVLIKQQSVMIHSDTVIFPAVCVEYAQPRYDWHNTNDPCPLPIHLRSSLCVPERRKLQPRWIHAALILGKTARGYVGNPASYLGGQMIFTTYPY